MDFKKKVQIADNLGVKYHMQNIKAVTVECNIPLVVLYMILIGGIPWHDVAIQA